MLACMFGVLGSISNAAKRGKKKNDFFYLLALTENTHVKNVIRNELCMCLPAFHRGQAGGPVALPPGAFGIGGDPGTSDVSVASYPRIQGYPPPVAGG